jgi:hypothetical protein
MNNKRQYVLLILAVFLLLSCNMLSGQTQQGPAVQEPPINVDTAVARTRAFDFAVQTAAAANQSGSSGQVVPATSQPPASTVEPTLGVPMISASVDTNCRTGPSTAYEILGYLLVGKTSEVVNKYKNGAWWVIINPTNPSQRCWVQGASTNVNGSWQQLAEATQPSTPTVGLAITIDGNVSNSNYTGACPVSLDYTWTITSTLPITMSYSVASSLFMFSVVQSTSFGPGTKTFNYGQTYNADGAQWEKFVINSPLSISEQVDVTINCI